MSRVTKYLAIAATVSVAALLAWAFLPRQGGLSDDAMATTAAPVDLESQHRQEGLPSGRELLSENVFQRTHSFGEALQLLIPRVKAGDYDAMFALRRVVQICGQFKSKGPSAYDALTSNPSAINEPLRRAQVTKLVLYCQGGDEALRDAKALLAGSSRAEMQAIKAGEPLAIVLGTMRPDTKFFAPESANLDAVNKALAEVYRSGTPWEKYQAGLAALVALEDPDVLAIDADAIRSNAGEPADLHLAAAQLYGCEVGNDCGASGEWHVSACILDGWCQQDTLQSYFNGTKFNDIQLGLINRYVDHLRTSADELRTGASPN